MQAWKQIRVRSLLIRKIHQIILISIATKKEITLIAGPSFLKKWSQKNYDSFDSLYVNNYS